MALLRSGDRLANVVAVPRSFVLDVDHSTDGGIAPRSFCNVSRQGGWKNSAAVQEPHAQDQAIRTGPAIAIRGGMIEWSLAGFTDVMHCEVVEAPGGCAVGLRMGDELILAELWPNVERARTCARELRTRLLARGWVERAD